MCSTLRWLCPACRDSVEAGLINGKIKHDRVVSSRVAELLLIDSCFVCGSLARGAIKSANRTPRKFSTGRVSAPKGDSYAGSLKLLSWSVIVLLRFACNLV